MFNRKNYPYLVIMLCFFTASFSFHLWAEELSIKADREKAKSKQKHVPIFTVEGTKIEIVPDKGAPEQQKSESKKEQVTKENQPQISLDSTHYDAGEIWEGDEIVHTFTAKNIGTAQLNIKYVQPG